MMLEFECEFENDGLPLVRYAIDWARYETRHSPAAETTWWGRRFRLPTSQ
jgi:hypothetical protein